jgi:hypothetical protein
MRRFLTLAGGMSVLFAGIVIAQQPRFGGGGMGLGRGVTANILLQVPEVQDDLKITDEQKEKMKAFQAEQRKGRESLKDLSKEELKEKMAEMMKKSAEANEKFLKETLTADQTKRLKQIQYQQNGLFTMEMKGFQNPPEIKVVDEIKTALKITDDQESKIKDIASQAMTDAMEMMKEAFSGGNKDAFKTIQPKIAAMQKESRNKCIDLLSADQKKAWEEMTGKPLEIKPESLARAMGAGLGGGRFGKKKDDKND